MGGGMTASEAESAVAKAGGPKRMPAPGLKEMARSRELKLGHFIVEFATPGIGQILKAAGCDFALFDTEHSGFGFETIKSVLRYIRRPTCRPSSACRPRNTITLRAPPTWAPRASCCRWSALPRSAPILDCMKYVPMGKRGVALGDRA